MSREHVHPIPLRCKVFGHLWHNRHSRGVILSPDRCMRRGCPGDDHLWEHQFVTRDNYSFEICVYPGCPASTTWKIPDMSGNAVRACRVCGCTDDRACPGGCFWVGPALCSRCQS